MPPVMDELTLEKGGDAMSVLFDRIARHGQPLSPDEIKDIQNILEKCGKRTWSARPRIYAVLRMIGKTDMMDLFVEEGQVDYNFPYQAGTLPYQFMPQSARNRFLEKQRFVLSDIKDAENGKHAHLAIEANVHFTIVKRLGSGGQGLVEKVTSQLSLRDYARKSFLRSRKFQNSKDAEKEFKNELRNLKRLSHRHLVKYIGSYTDPTVFAILLLPIADMDLKEFLSQDPFPEELLPSIRDFFGCITSAISYLHRSSTRHKDITPRNCLIKDNQIYVTDFGLSLDWSELSKSKTEGPKGKVTADYVAPEVWNEVGERGSTADLWPLGCVFLDMVTVLKGRSLEEKRRHFETTGSMGRNPRENFDAYQLWMSKLRELEPGRDCHPLLWTEKLIVMNEQDRGSADESLNTIMECEDEEDSHMYHCFHCFDERGEGFPIMAVPLEKEPQGQTGDTTTSKLGLQSIDRGLCQAVTNADVSRVVMWLSRWREQSTDMTSSKALHIAARLGRTSIMKELIKHGFDVNTQIDGRTPLHEAIESAHLEAAKLLLEQDADPNIHCHQGGTPLIMATKLGSEAIVAQLLKKGADVNATNGLNQTALHAAAYFSYPDIARLLLKRPGINPNIREKARGGGTPLMIAIERMSELVVDIFLASDAHVDVQGIDAAKYYLTPLHVAARTGNAAIVRKLIKGGAEVNAKLEHGHFHSPVHVAAELGNLEVLEALFEADVIPSSVDKNGLTFMHIAAYHGHTKLIPWLVNKGVDVDTEDVFTYRPLGIALSKEDFKTAKVLLAQGSDINGGKVKGYLHTAAMRADLPAMEFLLDNGADVDFRNLEGMTPLMFAIRNGNLMCISKLLDKGADINARAPRSQATTIFEAVFIGHENAFKLLLSRNADLFIRISPDNNNLLHVAAQGGNVPIGEVLIDRQLPIEERNKDGHTAEDIARLYNHDAFVMMLQARAAENRRPAITWPMRCSKWLQEHLPHKDVV